MLRYMGGMNKPTANKVRARECNDLTTLEKALGEADKELYPALTLRTRAEQSKQGKRVHALYLRGGDAASSARSGYRPRYRDTGRNSKGERQSKRGK